MVAPISPPPFLKRSLLSGNAADLKGEALGFYEECERQGDGIVRLRVWGVPVYVVTAPALIQEVLGSQHQHFLKSAGLRATIRAFGEGLLTSDGPLWRQQRKLLQPVFAESRMAGYAPVIARTTERMVARWRDDERRNVYRDMNHLCLDTLTASVFGEELSDACAYVEAVAKTLHECHQRYAAWVGGVGGIAFTAFRSFAAAVGRHELTLDATRVPTRESRRFRDAVDALDRYVAALVARRRAAPEGRGDLLSVLLGYRTPAGEPLGDRQIRDEIVTMFLAGHETTAASITWALYLLGRHPEVTARLTAELDDALGDGAATLENTRRLPLLDSVMMETWRLYPPAHRISRTVRTTCTIGGYRLRAGAELIIPQWAVHRSARHFADPEVFRPERWTPDFARSLPKYAFFPFGGGARVCIGKSLALVEAKLIIGTILRAFDLSLASDAPVAPNDGVTLLPKGGAVWMRVRRREPVGVTARVG